jgi:hypothetical protein
MSEVPPRRRAKSASAGNAEQSSLPSAAAAGVDPRVVLAWRGWLDALATDAEAALAAAMAYKSLDGAARDRWLGALEHDAAHVNVPRIAVYAPLLAVESDPVRRQRIAVAIGPDDDRAKPSGELSAFRGTLRDGVRVATIVSPLYLDFVQVLACGYRPESGFVWVRHDPIVLAAAAPSAGDEVLGALLEATPVRALVDELALAVLAHTRSGRQPPDALRMFADLFAPDVSSGPISSSSS